MTGMRTITGFRSSWALLLAVPLGRPAAAAGAPPPDPYAYETMELSRGVYGFFQREITPVASGNVVAVIGDSAVLVFDSGHHPPVTRRIVAELRKLTDKPVDYLVVSHWHDDHWVGNAEFADAWPGVHVVAHPFTARMIETRRATFAGEPCRSEIEGQNASLKQRVAAGTREDGTPLPEATMDRLRTWVEANDAYAAECAEMRFRGVDTTVDSTLTVDLGGRSVELRYMGRGNTAGDLVAWLPDARTLLTGDLVVAPFPFATQSYVSEWAAVLRRIEALDPAVIVPGHGAVMRDTAYVDRLAATLESITTQAKAAYRPGMTADELRERIDLAPFHDAFAHGDALIGANFDYMMKGPAIDRMWQELTGQWEPEGG